MARFVCCICGSAPDDPLNYVEITAHVPGHVASQVLGAHLSCVQPLFHPRYRLDEDILFDR